MAEEPEDSRMWLEDVDSDRSLDWVRARNAESEAKLKGVEGFDALQARIQSILDSDENIPYVAKRGPHYYNFWQDADHVQGIWRRTTLDSYLTEAPEWELVLDLDALNAAEGTNWVWHGSTCLPPIENRCLLNLSRGGADAVVVREFDTFSKTFVDGGFELPEAKSDVGWIDIDHIYVGTDFGEGSLTDSGYPRVVKKWKRGTPLSEAVTIFEGSKEDVAVGAYHDHTPGFERDIVYRSLTFYTNEEYLVTKKGLQKIDKPDHTEVSLFKSWIFFKPRKDWEIAGTTYVGGSLLAADLGKWMKGKRDVQVVFSPSDTVSMSGMSFTQNHVVLELLDNVRSRIEVHTPGKKGWTKSAIPGLPEFGEISISAVDSRDSDDFWMTTTDFLTPSSLWLGSIGAAEPDKIKETPGYFDTEGLAVSQHFATSEDGTKVPYFQIGPKDQSGPLPTLLYGYGGFEVSMTPGYRGVTGAAWLEKGGVYVLANIRGGGEYGPRWHQAALKENRHRAYEDFAAIARDLIARQVTTKAQLGAQGGSNGGLLMGNMYTLYPDDFGAIVCQVPLLDMKRYTKLLAGASWAGEYGDPDDAEQWKYIQTFSPYHNIDAAKDYPPILFTTSTRDDRVHPGHARKMAHALLEGGEDVLYYENIEGGHGGAANNEQRAFMTALSWSFLHDQLFTPAAPTE